jgi:hypothetical protein
MFLKAPKELKTLITTLIKYDNRVTVAKERAHAGESLHPALRRSREGFTCITMDLQDLQDLLDLRDPGDARDSRDAGASPRSI